MQLDARANLSKLRVESADKLLVSARLLIGADDYKSAANRSYYACFQL